MQFEDLLMHGRIVLIGDWQKSRRAYSRRMELSNYLSLAQGAHEGETTNTPSSVLRGRAAIEPALAVLKTFEKTTHHNGQNDVVIHGDYAVGESYCIAHQFSEENGKRKYEVLSIRYQDKFVRQDGAGCFRSES